MPMHAGDAKHTFLFADLAGYTALTEAMGDQDAADLAGATRTPGRAWGSRPKSGVLFQGTP
jgi:hypothetical protein